MSDGVSPWDDIHSIAAPVEPDPPLPAERFVLYRAAFAEDSLHGFNLAYLESDYRLPPPASAAKTPRSLIEWLRSPAVHASVRWPQDALRVPTDPHSPGDIDWIAQESQSLWMARIRPDDTTEDPIVEVVEPAEGPRAERMLGRMTLTELTARILHREHTWIGTLHDVSGHGLEALELTHRIIEPMTLGHHMPASWGGIGLGSYWYCSFFGPAIRIHTDDPERIAAEFDGHQHLYWEPR